MAVVRLNAGAFDLRFLLQGGKRLARYTDASCKLCRREGEKLFLKGPRCLSAKCALTRRTYAAGQHGQRRIKLSDYGIHLREKQKLRRTYGIMEKQFRSTFERAERMKGVTGRNLLQLLETRLDNVVYQLGYASTRSQARQLVSHGHILLNGRKLDIPSCQVNVKDEISLREKSKKLAIVVESLEAAGSRTRPEWLSFDPANLVGRVENKPRREDITVQVDEQLIVEFYSK